MHTLTCVGCGDSFEAKSPKAKWCTAACRKRVQRSGEEVVDSTLTDDGDHEDHALVITTRTELESAGRLDTFAGQLALQLAKRLASPDESGISSLSKELRTVMAAALEGVAPPSGEGEPATHEPQEDEVTRARRQREQARQAAGLA